MNRFPEDATARIPKTNLPGILAGAGTRLSGVVLQVTLLLGMVLFVAAYARWFDSTESRRSQVVLVVVAVVNVIPFFIGARLLCMTALSWVMTCRLFGGHLPECIGSTMRSYRRSLGGHSARSLRRVSFVLALGLMGSGILWGFQYSMGFTVLAVGTLLYCAGACCLPPVLLFLGPSDERALALAHELKTSLPFFRIAALLGGDIKIAKRVAQALGFDDFRMMRPAGNDAWLETTYDLHDVARLFVVDGRRRPFAPAASAEIDAISPPLQVEIKNLLRLGTRNRADRTIVVVDSDGQSPSLDSALYRSRGAPSLGSKLFSEPAHKVTASDVSSLIGTLLR